MLAHAFKEWAVVCRNLAEGRQSIILRKGGIAEEGNEFQLEHKKFWLYPTYVHQQREGITPETIALLEEVAADRPAPGIVRLSHFAEVVGIYHVHELFGALSLQDMHCWSKETVQKRYEYRKPGIYVLAVRVFQAQQSHELVENAAYAGCRSWVELEKALPTTGSKPVLREDDFRDILRELDRRLNPTALV